KSGYFVIFDDKDIYSASPSRKEDHAASGPVSNTPPESPAYPGKRAIDNLDFSYSIYAKTVRRILSDYGPMVTEKSPFQGLYDLRRAISDYLGRSRHIEVSPSQVIIGAGAEYLYGLIVETFGRNISYGIESPSYQKIAKVYEAGGARLEMLRLVSDGIDSRDLWSGNMKVLHITPYRSFPSGVTASASKKREYLKWSQQNDGFIVEDDFESEFTTSRKAEETLFSIDQNDRVIYVNTFTRTIGSFVRCAYMVLPERLLGLFEKKSGFRECPVPTLDQLVLAALINGGDFERHINRVRRHNRRS
ncbi:MAG: PLP-dependent aminotransferase family protein, partial [Butyrivibrio sp.]|nr:PLP-dependent aminotransferase family protein [Butyrivibrio sp.]